MKMTGYLATALLACGLVAGTPAVAADGPALYKENCAKCHGETGAADTWRGRLSFAEDFTDAHFQKNRTDDEILRAINRGPRIMPAYEKTLTLAERQALVKVLRSFSPKP